MQGRRYFDPKKLPPKVKARARQLLREKLDRRAAAERLAIRTSVQGLVRAICKGRDREVGLALLRNELRLWKGGCPAPTDAEHARKLIPELEAAIARLEATESVGAFLDAERDGLPLP